MWTAEKAIKWPGFMSGRGVKTQLMCLGFGTAKSEILEYLGLGDLEKEILFSAAPRAAIQTGLEKLRGELPFSRRAAGSRAA